MNENIVRLKRLSRKGMAEFLQFYLPILSKSIKVDFTKIIEGKTYNPTYCPGWGESRGASSWSQRYDAWIENGTDFMYLKSLSVVPNKSEKLWYGSEYIPLFANYVKKALDMCEPVKESKKESKPKEKNRMKNLFDKAVNVNKDAAKQAAQLTTGKAANQLLIKRLMGTMPWYARLVSRKEGMADNPIAKLIAANIASVLGENFAGGNSKISYVTDAMVQDAMLDLSYNSDLVKDLLNQLEGLVPSFIEAGK